MFSINEAIIKENETIEWYKKNKPESLVPLPMAEREIFQRIGIIGDFSARVPGYLRFYPGDFIVEEVRGNKEISTIEPKNKEIAPENFPFHLGCSMIKIGVSTFDAINILAKHLEIKPTRITYAGLKDDDAVTSQKIVILDINAEVFDKIKRLSLFNVFLSNFSIESRNLSIGNLFGNRFTIFVRTENPVDERAFFKKLIMVKNQGFLNYYSTQRFGTPRFLSHVLGKLIMQGRYRETILAFFSTQSAQETPLIAEKRELVRESFGDWKKVEEIFHQLPFTFRSELQLLEYLKKYPSDFTGALVFYKDQTKFWMYAYASYLFNQLLSERKLELPEQIPLLISNHREDIEAYKPFLTKDNTENFEENMRPFRFVKSQRRLVKTTIFPENISAKVVPEGVVMSFILEKGVYATTFLSNFFEVKEGLPTPQWIKKTSRDTKKLLGLGSIEAAQKNFGDNISSKAALF